ncbi:MAG: hypothetical protein WCK02_00705 [Bacteroidota bacterium]
MIFRKIKYIKQFIVAVLLVLISISTNIGFAQNTLSKTFIPYSDTNFTIHSSIKSTVYQDAELLNTPIDTTGLIKTKKNKISGSNGLVTVVPEIDLVGGKNIASLGYGLTFKFNYKNKIKANITGMSVNTESPEYFNDLFVPRQVYFGERNSFNTKLGLGYNRLRYNLTYTPSKYFLLEGGTGKHFIGDGYRSMLLSDNAADYPYFKVETNLWHLKYFNLWTAMKAADKINDKTYSKYGVFHYLSWNITKKINISIFESIIWQRKDSTGTRGFDVNYLNPIMFYRPVEFSLGSPDNSVLGLNYKVKYNRKNIFYGQLFIDDLIVGELKQDIKHILKPEDKNVKYGYWTNKQAFQIGWKSFDIFKKKGLMVQNEINVARPYTYSHRNPTQNYSNFYQSLTHPMGSNFMELVNFIKYNHKKIFLEYELLLAEVGLDTIGSHFGNNIFQSTYDTYDPKRPNIVVKQYENYPAQGIRSKLLFTGIKASYLLFPMNNLRVEAGIYYRSLTNELTNKYNYYFYFGIRTSLEKLNFDF